MDNTHFSLGNHLQFMAEWIDEQSQNIESILKEHALFTKFHKVDIQTVIGIVALDFEYAEATAFQGADDTNTDPSTLPIWHVSAAEDAVRSLAIGMTAFEPMRMAGVIRKGVTTLGTFCTLSALAEIFLNSTMRAIGRLASKSEDAYQYSVEFKKNNPIIASKVSGCSENRRSRLLLMHFLAQMQKNNDKNLSVALVRNWARTSQKILDDERIYRLYQSFEKLEMSERGVEDVHDYMECILELGYSQAELSILHYISINLMYGSLKIKAAVIEEGANAARNFAMDALDLAQEEGKAFEELEDGDFAEEVDVKTFELLRAVKKYGKAMDSMLKLSGTLLTILEDNNMTKQCEEYIGLCDDRYGLGVRSYKRFYQGLQSASAAYCNALGLPVKKQALLTKYFQKDC